MTIARANPMGLLWIDLETTGLDPREDAILEIAWSLTDFSFPYRAAPALEGSLVIAHPEARLERMASRVREMHEANGLVADVRASGTENPPDVIAAETIIMSALGGLLSAAADTANGDGKIVIAGSSVHFDLGFIRVHMPRLAALLSHRCFDVSAVVLACRSLGMPRDEKEAPAAHRARADLDGSMRRMRECVKWLGERSHVSCGQVKITVETETKSCGDIGCRSCEAARKIGIACRSVLEGMTAGLRETRSIAAPSAER